VLSAAQLAQPAQLAEAQAVIARFQQREAETGGAVEQTRAPQIGAEECERRTQQPLGGSAAAAPLGVQPLGGDRRVALHAREMLREVPIGMVQQIAAQMPDLAVHLDAVVRRAAGEPRAAAVAETELAIRIPAAVADPAAEVMGEPREVVARERRRAVREQGADLGGERVRDALVGVEAQHPVVAGFGDGGAAWSDLHASAFGSALAAGVDSSGTDVTVNDSSGGGFDFEGDFELERNTEVAAYYGARVGFAPFELSVAQFGYDGENDGNVSSASRFAGAPLSGDLLVTSELDVAVTKLMVGVDLLNTPAARIGLLAGLDWVEFDRFDLIARESKGSVAAGDVQTILEDESSPVPMIGVRADVAVPFLGRVGAEVTGLEADFDDADILYLDFDVAAHWEPWEHVEIMIGYRAIMMEVEGSVGDADLDVDLDVNGPYVGLSVYW
jgi:hypothetical protein